MEVSFSASRNHMAAIRKLKTSKIIVSIGAFLSYLIIDNIEPIINNIIPAVINMAKTISISNRLFVSPLCRCHNILLCHVHKINFMNFLFNISNETSYHKLTRHDLPFLFVVPHEEYFSPHLHRALI